MFRSIVNTFSNATADKPVTRFTQSSDLLDIVNQLQLLEKQKDLLDAHYKANGGAGSLDFQKFTIIDNLLKKINREVKKFNNPNPPSDQKRITEVTDCINLLKKMQEYVNATMTNDHYTLDQMRNNNKDYADTGMVVLGTTAVVMTGGLSFITVVGGFIASSLFTYYAKAKLDPQENSKHANSYLLVHHLQELVKNALRNLTDYHTRNVKEANIERLITERTWGAIALGKHPIFRNLPDDVKSLILNEVTLQYIDEKNIPNNRAEHDSLLFQTVREIVAKHEEADASTTNNVVMSPQ